MQYRFSSLNSLADYLTNRATMFRESAQGATTNHKRALFLERAVTHETIADMIRNTVICDGESTIVLNPQREK